MSPVPPAGQSLSGGHLGRDRAVALFRRYLDDHPELVEAARQELAGKDLAYWCKPGELCHADISLEVANQTTDR